MFPFHSPFFLLQWRDAQVKTRVSTLSFFFFFFKKSLYPNEKFTCCFPTRESCKNIAPLANVGGVHQKLGQVAVDSAYWLGAWRHIRGTVGGRSDAARDAQWEFNNLEMRVLLQCTESPDESLHNQHSRKIRNSSLNEILRSSRYTCFPY